MQRRLIHARSIASAAWIASLCFAPRLCLAQDRYGPPPPTDPSVAETAQPTAYIYWPGKPTAGSAPQAPALTAPTPAPSAAAAPLAARGPAPSRSERVASKSLAPRPWSASPTAAAPPVSAAPVARLAANAQTATVQSGLPPRFYSVQRDYGGAVPVALSQQFLADGASSDLAAPPPAPSPPPLAGQAATSSTVAAIRQRQAQDASVSDDGGAGN